MVIQLTQTSGDTPFAETVVLGLSCIGIIDTEIKCHQWAIKRASKDAITGGWLVIRLRLKK